MATKKKEPTFTVQNCTFTNQSPDAETIGLLSAIARAAESNARAIEKVADSIKGPDALLKLGCK